MNPRSLGHRAPLLWLVLPFAAGLVIARLTESSWSGFLLGFACAAAVIAVAAAFIARVNRAWAFSVCVALAAAGAASHAIHSRELAEWRDRPPREARLCVRVDRLFASRDARSATGIGRVVRADDPLAQLVGQRIHFSARIRGSELTPRRSAVVAIVGIVAPITANPESGSFDHYLASSGIHFRLNRARVVALEHPQHPYYAFCDRAAAQFRRILGAGIDVKRPQLAGLLRAMMLGETRELTDDQRSVFMQSGTMHLFAISGLNIGVIATAIQSLLKLARLAGWARFAIGVPLLWLFVDITGAAPSAVRAFAMAAFFQAAYVVRRPANALAALTGSAAVVLAVSPLQLFSASFLMSYTIVLALLVLGLPLADAWNARAGLWRDLPRVTWRWWQRRTDTTLRYLLLAVAIGVATTLVSFITSIQFFKLITPGALIANLVLIPAAMVVTLGGFAALLFGLLGLTACAVVCNHASALVLLIIEALVQWSVTLPWTHVAAEFKAPWLGGTALAALVGALLIGYGSRWRPERGSWWPPFVVVALTLGLGVRYG